MKGNRSTEEVEAIYHRHIKMVYQICLMLMKNVPDAEDAAQTVFRKVMEYPKPFRDPEHEKAWLIVTARNESLPCRSTSEWPCISAIIRAIPPGRRRRSWGRIPLLSAPGWPRDEKN